MARKDLSGEGRSYEQMPTRFKQEVCGVSSFFPSHLVYMIASGDPKSIANTYYPVAEALSPPLRLSLSTLLVHARSH